MPILLFLIAVLMVGGPASSTAIAQSATTPMPEDEFRHLAEIVAPPSPEKVLPVAGADMAVKSKAEPTAPEPTPERQRESAPSAVTSSGPATEPAPMLDPQTEEMDVTTLMAGDWVVQVGAFGNMEAAKRGAQLTGREGVLIIPIRQDGKDWYVVLLGSYDSHSEADDIGDAYMNDTGESYWVRRSSGLRSMMFSDMDLPR